MTRPPLAAGRHWRSLLARLARDAAAASWRGPLVLDELPYLVTVSPELPSVLRAVEAVELLAAVDEVHYAEQPLQARALAGGNHPCMSS